MAFTTLVSFFENSQAKGFLGPVLGYLTLFSVITFFMSLLFIPWIISRLSPTYFLKLTKTQSVRGTASGRSLLLIVLQNILGIIVLIAGIAMLFLPGQGLLTILLGLLLISLPGKKKMIISLIARPGIRNSMDWIRKKSAKQPFLWPDQ